MKKFIGALFALSLLSGCASVATTGRPADYYSNQPSQNQDGSPLFSSEGVGLSDKDIARVLSYRLSLPKINRIAILNLTKNDYWRHYSNDFVQLNDEVVDSFVNRLKASHRVYDASFLPSLLVPSNKTVPFLRVAAARYQADLLLVYRSKCQSFEKYKFIDPNITKAYCSIEAVLLDTRTGIVPFTMASTNEYTATKQDSDVNFRETIQKAELKSITKGLGEIAKNLVSFIEQTPVLK